MGFFLGFFFKEFLDKTKLKIGFWFLKIEPLFFDSDRSSTTIEDLSPAYKKPRADELFS